MIYSADDGFYHYSFSLLFQQYSVKYTHTNVTVQEIVAMNNW